MVAFSRSAFRARFRNLQEDPRLDYEGAHAREGGLSLTASPKEAFSCVPQARTLQAREASPAQASQQWSIDDGSQGGKFLNI